MNPAMLLLVASTVATPAPAPVTSAPTHFTVGHHVTFVEHNVAAVLEADRAPGSVQSPTHQVAGRTITVFIQGGIVFGGGHVGFGVGVMAAFTPLHDHEQFEVNADFNFGRFFGSTGFNLSFNGQYNIKLSGHKIVPFAGLGLLIQHGGGATNAGLQLVFGIQSEFASGRAIRFGVRFGFIGGGTGTALVFGFAF